MTFTAADLGGQAGQWLWAGIMVFLRVSTVAALLPGFGEQSVPQRIKLAVAICFTLVVLPAVAPQIGIRPDDLIGALRQAGPEVVAGLVFGIVLRLFVMALQMAGTIAAQSASLAQLFGGGPGAEPQPAIGHLLIIGGIALAAIMGLHVRVAEYLIGSYILIPPGTLPAPDLILTAGLTEVARSFALAFTLAAPFVAAALIYNLMLGVINRAMPQLMVTFVGAPALSAGGLLLLLLAAPVMLTVWADDLTSFLAAPFGALR